MGYAKEKRPISTPGIGRQNVVTLTSTASILPRQGVAVLNHAAAGDGTYRLPTPRAGARLLVLPTKSTHIHTLRTFSTAETFFNSTKNLVAAATAGDRKVIDLVGVSTSKWAVVSISTGCTIS